MSLDDLHKYLTGSGLDCPDWHVTDASTSHISVGMCDADTMLAWTDEDQGQETAFRLYLGVGAQSMQKAQNDEPTTLAMLVGQNVMVRGREGDLRTLSQRVGGKMYTAKSEYDGAATDSSRAAAVKACEAKVSDQLKAPSTAKFSGVEVDANSGYEWVVSGDVDAENSFSAMIRNTWTCIYLPPAQIAQDATIS